MINLNEIADGLEAAFRDGKPRRPADLARWRAVASRSRVDPVTPAVLRQVFYGYQPPTLWSFADPRVRAAWERVARRAEDFRA